MRKLINFSGTGGAPAFSFLNIQHSSTKKLFSLNAGKPFRAFALLMFMCFSMSFSGLFAQDPSMNDAAEVKNAMFPEPDCFQDPCPCEGGIKQVKVFYFGEDNVDIEVYGNNSLSIFITSFSGVNKGDLLVIDGTGTALGTLYTKTFFKVTNALGETCITRIDTKCPTNAWPGALEDLKIVGNTYADFTVYSITDHGNNNECTIDDVDQDWHVGGNIIGPTNNTMGTRNNENVVFITNDVPRGVITTSGDFGINTLTPSAKLDVQGNALIEETLDVNGIARMNSGTGSTNTNNGALVVTGGAGVSENLNVGNDANIGHNLDVSNDAEVGNDLDVSNNTSVGNDLIVADDGTFGGEVQISSSPGLSLDLGTNAAGNTFTSTGADLFLSTTGTNLLINTQPGDGKVAIGTVNIPNAVMGTDVSGYKLFVQGGILTEEVRVRSDWADFVFGDQYYLRPLTEVKQFIQKHGHLPGTPSALEIQKSGLELAANATNQQVKIEELFLYLIQLDEKVNALEAENARLKALWEQK